MPSCRYPSNVFYVDPLLPCKKACSQIYSSIETVLPLIEKIPPQEKVTVLLYPGVFVLKQPVILRHPNIILSAMIPGTVDIDGVLEIIDESYSVPAKTLLTGFSIHPQIRFRLGHSPFSQQHILRDIRGTGTFFKTFLDVVCHSTRVSTSIIQMFLDGISLQDKGDETVFDLPPLFSWNHEPVTDHVFPLSVSIKNSTIDTTVANRILLKIQDISTLSIQDCSLGSVNGIVIDCMDVEDLINIKNMSVTDSPQGLVLRTRVLHRPQKELVLSNIQINASTFIIMEGHHVRTIISNSIATCTNSVLLQETDLSETFQLLLLQNCTFFSTQDACVKVKGITLGIQSSRLTSLGGSQSTLEVDLARVDMRQSNISNGEVTALSVQKSRLDIVGCQLQGAKSALMIENTRATVSASSLIAPVGIELIIPSGETLPPLILNSIFLQVIKTALLGIGNGVGTVEMNGVNIFGTEIIGEPAPESDTKVAVIYPTNRNFSSNGDTFIFPFRKV